MNYTTDRPPVQLDVRYRLGISLQVLILVVAAIITLLLALAVSICFSGRSQAFLLYYYVPISAPFTAFALDRFHRRQQSSRLEWMVDGIILTLGLARTCVPVPWISGHALFLTYAPLTTPSRAVQVLALAVMLQVVHLKAFFLRDPTLLGGIALGIIAALGHQAVNRTNRLLGGNPR